MKLESKYIVGEPVGSGACSRVMKGVNRITGENVAIKFVTLGPDPTRPVPERVEREIRIMQGIHHENIIELKEVMMDEKHLYIIMEYADKGSLHKLLVSDSSITEEFAFRIFHQLTSALDYIHKHDICHRDVKMENILLTTNGTIKLCDFGLSTRSLHRCSTPCGSPHYAAPEVTMAPLYDGVKADMWSLGVVLYGLLFRKLPFLYSDLDLLRREVVSGKIVVPRWAPCDQRQIISGLLDRNPDSRMCMVGMFESDFWKQRCYQYDLTLIPGAADSLVSSGEFNQAEFSVSPTTTCPHFEKPKLSRLLQQREAQDPRVPAKPIITRKVPLQRCLSNIDAKSTNAMDSDDVEPRLAVSADMADMPLEQHSTSRSVRRSLVCLT